MEGNFRTKKPIYRRWWFWLIVVIVAIGIRGAASEEDAKQAGSQGTATTAEPTKEAEKLFKIGDTVEVGKFGITINSCTEQDKFKSDNMFIDDVTTEGKFVVIDARVTNNDNESRTIDTSMFKLMDSQNREFNVYNEYELMTILGDKYLFLEAVNPGMSRNGVFVFEVPKDVNEYSLKMYPGILFKTGIPEKVKLK